MGDDRGEREKSTLEPIFPRWFDSVVRVLGGMAGLGVLYVIVLVTYGASPKTYATGYQPTQPVPYSHTLHAGELGIDCRYCHTGVETGAKANIPPTQTCMNCHSEKGVHSTSEKLLPVRESFATGMPVEWIRVHDLPDFVFFNHSAHVKGGVGCVSCHGRVDKMEVVYQENPLNMGWCLDCHRDPAPHLRPLDKITDMSWQADDPVATGKRLMEEYGTPDTEFLQSCSTCHR